MKRTRRILAKLRKLAKPIPAKPIPPIRRWAYALAVFFSLIALLFAQINFHQATFHRMNFGGIAADAMARAGSGGHDAHARHYFHSENPTGADRHHDIHRGAYQGDECHRRHVSIDETKQPPCGHDQSRAPFTGCDCAFGCNGACPAGSALPMSEGMRIAQGFAAAEWPAPLNGAFGRDLAPPSPPPKSSDA